MVEKLKDIFDWYKIITMMEKTLLVIIAFLTTYAVVFEILSVVSTRAVTLTDLLLLFIYAEVLGMVAAFYKFRKIPITVPIFIAITALCRLIILQGKGINTIDLLYESGAILLLALAALIIRWNLLNLKRPKDDADRETE
jgi:protein PsiE